MAFVLILGMLVRSICAEEIATMSPATCGDSGDKFPTALLHEGIQALFIGDLEESRRLGYLVERSLSCPIIVSSEDISQYNLLRGYLYFLDGNTEKFTQYLQLSVDADYWNEDFGLEIADIRNNMRPDEKKVHITVELQPSQYLVVDGQKQEYPWMVSQNLHLLQVLDGDGNILFSRYQYYQDTYHIALESAVVPRIDSPHHAHRLLLLGGVTIGLHGMASWSQYNMGKATEFTELERYHRQKWAVGSFAILGTVLTGMELYLYLQDKETPEDIRQIKKN